MDHCLPCLRAHDCMVTAMCSGAPAFTAVAALSGIVLQQRHSTFLSSLFPTADPVSWLACVAQAAALVGNGGGLIPTIGLVVGLGVSSFMMYYNIKRAMDLKYDDGDWPGPRAWPSSMGLVSFFAVTVFLQALVADISTKV